MENSNFLMCVLESLGVCDAMYEWTSVMKGRVVVCTSLVKSWSK